MQADQDISFQAMEKKLTQMMAIVQHDPAVQNVVGFTGQGSGGAGGQGNSASVFVALKPLGQRPAIDQVIGRLRRELSRVPGARLFLQPVQDIRVGGRSSNAAYQYTLQGDSSAELYDGRRNCSPCWRRTRCCATSTATSSRRGWRPT